MTSPIAPFPANRPRRLRRTDWMRDLVRENDIKASDFIWPIFIMDGSDSSEPVPSMLGVERLTIDRAVIAANEAANLGIPVIALFPYTDVSLKTPECEEAYNPENLVNRATRAIKSAVPDIGIMLDVALDPYNSLGHDGIVHEGEILNDQTLMVLERQALSHAEAGADILGPSDMMDGRVGIIRRALEQNDLSHVAIMAYSAKYSSAFYGPFRDAVGATGALTGDKSTYQMDAGNSDEAMRMIARDLDEGADMVMVKPGQPYLDICQRVNTEFQVPTFAYQVSGEYAMIEAASANGWVDRDKIIMESLLAFKRAGCAGILTYYAREVAEKLSQPF